MSREVEVTGINMTATVPEDLQISLGAIYIADNSKAAVETDKLSLANSTGTIKGDNGTAVAPTTNAWDWSNSADISKYYAFGRLIPASSTTGEKIFYTPDASGVGQTVKDNASYYQANDALYARPTNSTTTATADDVTANSARATLHAYTAKNGAEPLTSGNGADTWSTATNKTFGNDYTQAADWKVTNDDGYYVDIPIWLRTSSNEKVNLSVDGYVLPGSLNTGDNPSNKETDLELYRAVRVALLDGATEEANATTGKEKTTAGEAAVKDTNIIPLKDAWNTSVSGDKDANGNFTKITAQTNPWVNTLKSVVDSINVITTGRTAPAGLTSIVASEYQYAANALNPAKMAGVESLADAGTDAEGRTYYAGQYANYTTLVPTSKSGTNASPATTPSTVVTVPGSTTAGDYGTPQKLIIRVWLDGEDGECWNDNAGQDWAISLRFSKIEASGS